MFHRNQPIPSGFSTSQYKYTDRVNIGMENAPASFNLTDRVLGAGGRNLRYIKQDTGAQLTLQGSGSEPNIKTNDPLHIYIQHHEKEGLQAARTMVVNLIKTVQEECRQLYPQFLKTQPVQEIGQLAAPTSTKPSTYQNLLEDYKRDYKPESRDNYKREYQPESKDRRDYRLEPKDRRDYRSKPKDRRDYRSEPKDRRDNRPEPKDKKDYPPEPEDDYKTDFRLNPRNDYKMNYQSNRKDDYKRDCRPRQEYRRDYTNDTKKDYKRSDRKQGDLSTYKYDKDYNQDPKDRYGPRSYKNIADYKTENEDDCSQDHRRSDNRYSPTDRASNDSDRLSASSSTKSGGKNSSTKSVVNVEDRTEGPSSSNKRSRHQSEDNDRDKTTTNRSTNEKVSEFQKSLLELEQYISDKKAKKARLENNSGSTSDQNEEGQIQAKKVPSIQNLTQQIPTLTSTENRVSIPRDLGTLRPGMSKPTKFGVKVGTTFLKSRTVICGNQSICVCSVPENGESFYSSCAYQLFGPFQCVNELNSVARKLHLRAVNYIRNDKQGFLSDLIHLYDELFPNHGLDPDKVFDHCCFYLSKPGHSAVQLTMIAISNLFLKRIIVLHESGKEATKITPKYQMNANFNNDNPIVLVQSENPINHFDPVATIPEMLKESLLSSSTARKADLSIASWYCESLIVGPCRENIDELLSLNQVTLACIQKYSTVPYKAKTDSTTNYNWLFSDKCPSIMFLLHKHCPGKLTNFSAISFNLATAIFSFNNTDFLLIGCILPSSPKDLASANDSFESNGNFDAVTNDLNDTVKKAKQEDVFLFGQFNALIGSKKILPSERSFIGTHLMHDVSNGNGEFIKWFAKSNKFKILSTFASANSGTPMTFHCAPGACSNTIKGKKKKKYQISHLLVRSKKASLKQHFRCWHPISRHAVVASKLFLLPY